MPSELLGRTNQAFPPVWLSLSAPLEPAAEGWNHRLVEAAVATGAPIDVTSAPAVWGGALRQIDPQGDRVQVTVIGTHHIERAADETNAVNLTQAHLIETLSSLGRETLDFYFVRVRRATEEFQFNGHLEALEMAREEGHIKYLGICCDGPALATLGMWQFHDAFEALLVPRNHADDDAYRTLAPLARERRVGVVTSRPLNWGYGLPFTRVPELWRLRNLTQSFYGLSLAQAAIARLAQDHPVMVGVRSAEEAVAAVEAAGKPLPEGLEAALDQYATALAEESTWESLAQSDDPFARMAVKNRRRALDSE